jgi:hypothetical protein
MRKFIVVSVVLAAIALYLGLPSNEEDLPPWPLFSAAVFITGATRSFLNKITPPSLQMLSYMQGFMQTQALYAAAKLKIADILTIGPMNISEISQNASANEKKLLRLMRALVQLGIFIENKVLKIATILLQD